MKNSRTQWLVHNDNMSQMFRETAMASAALTVEADDNAHSPHVVGWLLLHRNEGFVPSPCVERLYVFVLHSIFKIKLWSKTDFVRAADLGVLMNHPCDLPSREKTNVSLVMQILMQ